MKYRWSKICHELKLGDGHRKGPLYYSPHTFICLEFSIMKSLKTTSSKETKNIHKREGAFPGGNGRKFPV